MTTDRYTRIVLTVIAASLAVDAGSRFFAIPNAYAAGEMKCRIEDVVKVEGTIQIDTFTKAITVKVPDTLMVKQQK